MTKIFLVLIVLLMGCSENDDILNDIVWHWQTVQGFHIFDAGLPENETDVSRISTEKQKWILVFNSDGSWDLSSPVYDVPISMDKYGFVTDEIYYKVIISGKFNLDGRNISISAKNMLTESNNPQTFKSAWGVTEEEYSTELFEFEQFSGNYTVWVKDNMLRLSKSNGQEIVFRKVDFNESERAISF